MISEFICLEMIKRSSEDTIYRCSLPDPDIEHEDSMVLCGYVQFFRDFDTMGATIKIELLSNFRELCAGDIYQRKQFVSTILDLIRRDTYFEENDVRIILYDFKGSFIGKLHDL